MGNYIDDFYKELNIVNLINYYDRNDTQLQEATIVAATKIHFGETMKFTQAMMFDQLQIYKNKKKTLKRKIESYINHPEINVNKSKPFNDQLEQLLEQKEVIIEKGGLVSKIQSYDMIDSETYIGIPEMIVELENSDLKKDY